MATPNDGQPPPHDHRNSGGAWRLLVAAAGRVPGGRWVFGPVALAAAAAIILGLFLGSTKLAFFGVLFVTAFLLLFYAFAKGTEGRVALTGPLLTLVWSVTGLFVIVLCTLYLCVFWGRPLDLRHWVDSQSTTNHASNNESSNPAVCVAMQLKYQRLRRIARLSSASCQFADAPKEVEVASDADCAAHGPDAVCVPSASASEKELTQLRTAMWRTLYARANPWIKQNLDRSAELAANHRGPSELHFVQAPAGLGKSWALIGSLEKDKAFSSDGSGTYVYKTKPQRLIREVSISDALGSAKTPDLRFHGKIISELKGSIAADKVSLVDQTVDGLISTASKEGMVLILDGLDELHPDVAVHVTNRVRAQLQNKNAQVYVLGRPEAMPKVMDDTENLVESRHTLAFPRYDAFADVITRWNNWVLFRQSKFKIPIDNNTSLPRLAEILRRSPTACSSFSHLVVSNWIISQGRLWVDQVGQLFPETQIQATLFEELLRRNADTHDRPKEAESEYVDLLGRFVYEFMDPFESGEFKIPFAARFDDNNDLPTPRALLNYSGLININPVDDQLYSFQPGWVPLELIRRYARHHGCVVDV